MNEYAWMEPVERAIGERPRTPMEQLAHDRYGFTRAVVATRDDDDGGRVLSEYDPFSRHS